MTWKEKRHRERDLLSVLEKPIVPMARLHFPEHYSGAIYLHFNIQMWTQEKVLSSYNHAMILILPAKSEANSLHVRFGYKEICQFEISF